MFIIIIIVIIIALCVKQQHPLAQQPIHFLAYSSHQVSKTQNSYDQHFLSIIPANNLFPIIFSFLLQAHSFSQVLEETVQSLLQCQPSKNSQSLLSVSHVSAISTATRFQCFQRFWGRIFSTKLPAENYIYDSLRCKTLYNGYTEEGSGQV